MEISVLAAFVAGISAAVLSPLIGSVIDRTALVAVLAIAAALALMAVAVDYAAMVAALAVAESTRRAATPRRTG